MKIREHTTLHPKDREILKEFVGEHHPEEGLDWEDRDIVFYVAILERFIVGVSATLEYEHGRTCIVSIVVDRKHRHKGIGTFMLEHIVERNHDHDISVDVKLRIAGLLYFYCRHERFVIQEIMHKRDIVILAMTTKQLRYKNTCDLKRVSGTDKALKKFVADHYDGPSVEMDSPNIECVLAIHKGIIEGIILTKPCGTKGTHIKLLVVASNSRNNGVGSRLLNSIRQIYPDNKITLNVVLKDAGILNFFCNKGYATLHGSSMGCENITLAISKAAVLSRIPLPAS